MNKKNILKSNSFLYPSKEERLKVDKPKIKRLKLKYESAFIKIAGESSFNDSIREEDLYWWNQCLNNRIGKLEETYRYVVVHFERLIESSENTEGTYTTDEFLYYYYVEIFYYYYFSTRDVLSQLLNHLFNLKIAENRIYFNRSFIEKISDIKVRQCLSVFLDNTKNSYKIRNSFNHRFTPIYSDNRASRTFKKENKFILISESNEYRKEDFLLDIKDLMEHFSNLMRSINSFIKKTT